MQRNVILANNYWNETNPLGISVTKATLHEESYFSEM
jgi:hypothetical protein